MSIQQKESQLIGNIILTAIMLGLMILSFQLWDNNRILKMDHKQNLEELSVKLEHSSEKQLTYKQRLLLASNPSTKKILLKGTKNSPESYATIMYNSELNKILIDPAGMEDAQEGMSLQLWEKSKGDYKSIFIIDNDQDLITIDFSSNNVSLFLITLQMDGGEEQPDMDYIFAQGKVK